MTHLWSLGLITIPRSTKESNNTLGSLDISECFENISEGILRVSIVNEYFCSPEIGDFFESTRDSSDGTHRFDDRLHINSL